MNAQIGEELVRYSGGHEVFRHGSALGKHAKVFDAEMAGLSTAKKFILNSDPDLKPTHVIFYANVRVHPGMEPGDRRTRVGPRDRIPL